MKFHKILYNNNNVIKKLQITLYAVITLICLIPIILSIFLAPISPDSAYYLSIVERISDGIIPYSELKIGYTPLVFYITLAFKKIFSVGINYEFYLTLNYIFQLACAFLIFKITNLFTKQNLFSFLAAAFFLISAHWNDGNYFLLEIPALFFGLTAIYLCLTKSSTTSYFTVGLFTAASFLCKQYGLGFLALSFSLALFETNKIKSILLITLGFTIPVICCFLYWGHDFFNAIFTEYGKNRTLVDSLLTFSNRVIYLFVRVPILIASFYYIPIIYKKSEKQHKKAILFLLFAISGFFLQFYFAKYAHYYLLILPFVSILTFLILSKNNTKTTTFIVGITFLMSVYATYHDQFYCVYIKQNDIRNNQYKLSLKLLKLTDRNKTLYISDVGLISQYYLTNMQPPNINTIGYTFGMALNKETHLKQINSAAYIIKYKTETNNYGLNSEEAAEALKKRKRTELGDIYLYQ